MDRNNERRQSIRGRLATNVSAYYQIEGVRRRCKVRDLSGTGLFVELNPQHVRAGELVDIVITQRFGAITKVHCLVATVIRVSEDGAGMLLLGRTAYTREPPHRRLSCRGDAQCE